jgi:AcrR family transcriptional regulator
MVYCRGSSSAAGAAREEDSWMASRKKKAAAKTAGDEFANDAERSKADILAVATEEFATHGLSGARVDAIAERTRTSKRMIYYYFKGKEGLYRAVLEKAYSEIRSLDSHEGIEDADPPEAIRRIIELTFDYDEMHPFFVSLVSVENVHQGRNIARLPSIKKRNASVIRVLTSILERGAKQGIFRSDVNAVDLHLLISAFCIFRVANRFTFGTIFDTDLSDPAIRNRHKKMHVEAVLRYLEPRRKN